MKLPYMPMWWADYLIDTMQLPDYLHGNYLLLLGAYWVNGGPLEANDETLAAAARCSLAEWPARKRILQRYFRESDGLWHHKRCDEEMLKASKLVSDKSDAGRKGARNRWQNDGSAIKNTGNRNGSANGSAIENNAQVSDSASTDRISPKLVKTADRAQNTNDHSKGYGSANGSAIENSAKNNGSANANSELRERLKDTTEDTTVQPLAGAPLAQTAISDHLASLCSTYQINLDSMALLIREGFTTTEIEYAILQCKSSNKTPSHWPSYLRSLCRKNREAPPQATGTPFTATAPGQPDAPVRKVPMSEADRRKLAEIRGEAIV